MQEQIVGFEVAKLAKDRGFDWLCKYAYDINKKLFHDSHCNTNWNDKVFLISECSAPTQALLQKWLREKHEVHVQIIVNYEQRNQTRSYRVGIIHITQLPDRRFLQTIFIRPENDKDEFIEFSTYEEALEDGLFETLKLIE